MDFSKNTVSEGVVENGLIGPQQVSKNRALDGFGLSNGVLEVYLARLSGRDFDVLAGES